MNYFDIIKINAMHSVLMGERDSEYELRKIFRWYSEKYHTPLEAVEDLPLEKVLQTYFEVRYAELAADANNEEAFIKEVRFLIENEEQRKARRKKELYEQEETQSADDKFFEEAQSEANKEVGSQNKDVPIQSQAVPIKDSQSAITEIEPDIELKFVDDEEMQIAMDKADNWGIFDD